MIKLLFRLAIVALLGNAVYRIGSEYLTFVNFRDGVRDAAMFKSRNDDELSALIMELAGEFDVPLKEGDFKIVRREPQVNVSGHYEKPIEIAPGFRRAWPFSWNVDVTASYIVPPFKPRPKI